jgi:hypothetical protein
MKKITIVIMTALIIISILPMLVNAHSSEIIIPDGPLHPGKLSEVTVVVREIGTKALVEGAEVKLIGCGVNMNKLTNHKGEALFAVVPTETGRIKVTAEYNGMVPTKAEIPVVPDKRPPNVGFDPQVSPTSKKSLTVTGTTSPGAVVYVNKTKATVDAEGNFTATIALQEGKNVIVVKASNDYATTTRQFEVVCDTTPPSMILDTKVEDEKYVDIDKLVIRGRVDPGSEVEVNGVKATVVNDIFIAEIPVNLGNNKLHISAMDRAGNESTLDREFDVRTRTEVKAQIDSKTAYINGEAVEIDAPAQIIDGRTVVPLRFIGEAFNAEVDWEETTKTITVTLEDIIITLQINSKTAVVNGNIETLDVPAQISSGRTVVPFRFLGESLGCDVEWDATTKTVIMVRETIP